MDALDDADIRWRVFQSRPINIDDAVRVAIELEAFHMAERQRGQARRPAPAARVVTSDETDPAVAPLEQRFATFTSTIGNAITEGFNNLQKQLSTSRKVDDGQKFNSRPTTQRRWARQGDRGTVECWNCHETGHFRLPITTRTSQIVE